MFFTTLRFAGLVVKNENEQKSSQTANLFQKVIVTAKRAKSLYELDEASKAAFGHKPTFQAILETNQGKIRRNNLKFATFIARVKRGFFFRRCFSFPSLNMSE